MKLPKEIVFATNNAHKLQEVREIVGSDCRVLSLAEIGCHDDIPETADTIEGNALLKARWVKERYGYDCFADDTGLEVDALGGAPGVRSARYPGRASATSLPLRRGAPTMTRRPICACCSGIWREIPTAAPVSAPSWR